MSAPAARLDCSTTEVVVGEGVHAVRVAVGVCWSAERRPIEVVLNRVDRSRGEFVDAMLSDIAVALSRTLQGRDPQTGREHG